MSDGGNGVLEHEAMRFVSLWNNDPVYGTSWDDCTEAKERERDARHLRWLSTMAGGWDRPFPWGRIYCGIDSKSVGATIIVKYDRAWSRARGVYQRLRGSLHR